MMQRTIIPDVQKLRAEIDAAPWIKCEGKIVYDPPRPGMKHRTAWWCILQINKDITAYYRWQLKATYGIELCKPSWDAHISIIRGEKPKPHLMHLWKKYNNKTIEFEYQPFLRFNGDTRITKSNPVGSFWFVDARANLMTTIRDEFELKSDWNQHITVGRKWQTQNQSR